MDTTRARQALLLALPFLTGLPGVGSAQGAPSTELTPGLRPAHASYAPQARSPLAPQAPKGGIAAFQVPPQDGPTLLREIAAARVALDVDGDLQAVAHTLDELATRVFAADGFAGQAEAFVQLALARAELHLRLGQPDVARQFLMAGAPTRFSSREKLTLVDPSQKMLDALVLAQGDERLRARLAELQEAAQERASEQGDSLQRLIDTAWEANRRDDLLALGSAAFPRLSELALESPDELAVRDVLVPLVEIDERRAARFFLEHLDAGGVVWRKRILRAMTHCQVLENAGSWTETPPFVCLEPEWLTLVQTFLADPSIAADALPFFAWIERRDALSESLVAAFRPALLGFGPDFATAAMRVFDHEGVVASAQPALEAALALPDARLRRFAAQKLVNFPRSEALLACVRDGDVEIRRCVAQALGERKRRVWDPYSQAGYSEDRKVQLDERDAAVLRVLLADADPEIRSYAVALIGSLERPLDETVIARLLEDPEPEVRAQLVGVTQLAPAVRSRVLAQLARDPAQQVLQILDNVLQNQFHGVGAIAKNPGTYAEVLELRWKDTTRPIAEELRSRMWEILGGYAEGTRLLVSWTLSGGKPEERKLLERWTRTEHLLALPDELLARLLASSDAPGAWKGVWDPLLLDPPNRLERPAAMRLLMTDEQAPRRVRLTAARLAAAESPAFRQAFLALLRHPSWKDRAPSQDETNELVRCGNAFEPAARNAFALEVLRDAAIAAPVADAFVASYEPEAAHGTELAQAVLARWLKPGAPRSRAVESTLYRLGQIPELVQPDLLEQALPAYPYAVVDAIGELADTRFLPLLALAMRADWLPANERDDLQESAAVALGAFDDDQAVDLLLAGLRSNDSGVRGVCTDSLTRIKAYRAQVDLWRGGARATPTKEGALSELLAMLGDADPLVRKEAARGLGSLRATEALPSLIRALKDADPGVRAAAQAAIDRLNEPGDGKTQDAAPAGG